MIPILELIRLEESHRFGTFGVLRINKEVFCVTLEPRDEENVKEVSSIPAQQYICVRHQSPKFGPTFEITDVPGRSHVLFHSGNRIEHTSGCILLAEHFGKLQGDRAILNSGKTFREFLEFMHGYAQAHLTIYEHF